MIDNWFINIACSRQIPPRRLNRSPPEIVSIFSGDILSTAKNAGRLRAGGVARNPKFTPECTARSCELRNGNSRSDSRPSRAARGIFRLPLPRSEPCRMAERGMRANPDRRDHFLAAQSGGHRVPLAPSRRAPKTRKETMSDISR